jgi:hypothetical protein
LKRLLHATQDADLEDVARQLGDLRNYRNEADYDLNRPRPENETHVDLCIKTAVGSVQDLVKVIGDAPRWNKIVGILSKDPSYAPRP